MLQPQSWLVAAETLNPRAKNIGHLALAHVDNTFDEGEGLFKAVLKIINNGLIEWECHHFATLTFQVMEQSSNYKWLRIITEKRDNQILWAFWEDWTISPMMYSCKTPPNILELGWTSLSNQRVGKMGTETLLNNDAGVQSVKSQLRELYRTQSSVSSTETLQTGGRAGWGGSYGLREKEAAFGWIAIMAAFRLLLQTHKL